MNEENLIEESPQQRVSNGQLIVRALLEYGPLSISSIRWVTGIESDPRNLQRTMMLLVGKQLIKRVQRWTLGTQNVFWEIRRDERAQRCIERFVGIRPTNEGFRGIRGYELLHEQVVAKLQYDLKKRLPNADLARDFDRTYRSNIHKEIFIGGYRDYLPVPDLLLKIPAEHTAGACNYVCVEYERTRKSHKRMKSLLRAYCSESLLDGLIYLSDDEGIMHFIESAYKTNSNNWVGRCKHYEPAFMLLGVVRNNVEDALDNLHTVDGRSVKFDDWIKFLSTVPNVDRGRKVNELATTPYVVKTGLSEDE